MSGENDKSSANKAPKEQRSATGVNAGANSFTGTRKQMAKAAPKNTTTTQSNKATNKVTPSNLEHPRGSIAINSCLKNIKLEIETDTDESLMPKDDGNSNDIPSSNNNPEEITNKGQLLNKMEVGTPRQNKDGHGMVNTTRDNGHEDTPRQMTQLPDETKL